LLVRSAREIRVSDHSPAFGSSRPSLWYAADFPSSPPALILIHIDFKKVLQEVFQ
jgi:hypothetical protein